MQILQTKTFHDLTVSYLLDENTQNVGLMLLPAGMEPVGWSEKKQNVDSLVQLKLAGDAYPGAYSGGNTMRQSISTRKLRYQSQQILPLENGTEIVTVLSDDRGNTVEHHLRHYGEEESVETFTVYQNDGAAATELELLSSFSLMGLTPFTPGDAANTLVLHRIRSVWSAEGRVESIPVEALDLEPSWSGHAIRAERFGQVGSMPVSKFFPCAFVEDTKNGVVWGAQIAHNASWQIEAYRKDDGLALSGGLADREFGHWMKRIQPGERFETPHAILTVGKGTGIDHVSQRLTRAGMKYFTAGPASEQTLPIIFNEYCTTWGCPSAENIAGIVDAIKDRPIDYFVIDAGWYKKDGVSWDKTMGDYQPSATLFPEGLEKTTKLIRDHGMRPGIWFEIDNVGEASTPYHQPEKLLHRDGAVLQTDGRRFWDMANPAVEAELTEKVIGTLQTYGFGYMKMDYNDTIGLGCDGCESLGEGLRRNMKASEAFIRKAAKEVPDLVLENCASGGHKLEPLMMSLCSMASFSDAHEEPEIPVIAAALHRTILPCQSQIWAVIRKTDSLKRIAYSLTATMLGRMCFSGDVTELTADQWKVIDDCIAMYRQIAPVIKNGESYFYGTPQPSWRHLTGWQALGRFAPDGSEGFVVLHTFEGTWPQELTLELPGDYTVEEICSDQDIPCRMEGKTLCCTPKEAFEGICIRLKKRVF